MISFMCTNSLFMLFFFIFCSLFFIFRITILFPICWYIFIGEEFEPPKKKKKLIRGTDSSRHERWNIYKELAISIISSDYTEKLNIINEVKADLLWNI